MNSSNNVLYLLESYIDNEKIISHSLGISHYTYHLATKINEFHPSLGIDPSIVRIVALLHDIGKSKKGLHELNSHHLFSSLDHHELSELVMYETLY